MRKVSNNLVKIALGFIGIIMCSTLLFTLKVGVLEDFYLYSESMSKIQFIIVRGLAIILFFIIMYFFYKMQSLKWMEFKYTEMIIVGFLSISFCILSVLWNYNLPYHAEADQLYVWQAAELASNDNFVMFQPGGYMGMFPHQKGLVFLFETLFRVFQDTSFKVVGYFNASTTLLTCIFGYLLIKEISGTKFAGYCYLICLYLFVPYIIYTPYNYGDMSCIGFVFLLLWSVMKYNQTLRYRYIGVAAIAAIFSYYLRAHTVIVLIAVAIMAVIYALKHFQWRHLLLPLIMMIVIVGSNQVITISYEMRSGYKDVSGIPRVVWFAMGLQYDDLGIPGHYNFYPEETYYDNNKDYELTKIAGEQYLENRIKEFLGDPDTIWPFFREKLRIQWNDPLFESMVFSGTFRDATLSSALENLYYGEGADRLLKFMYQYLFIIYLFAAFGVVINLIKDKKEQLYLPILIFIGGFIFSIFYESKARYSLLFIVVLLIIATYGIARFIQEVEGLRKLIKQKLENKKAC